MKICDQCGPNYGVRGLPRRPDCSIKSRFFICDWMEHKGKTSRINICEYCIDARNKSIPYGYENYKEWRIKNKSKPKNKIKNINANKAEKISPNERFPRLLDKSALFVAPNIS